MAEQKKAAPPTREERQAIATVAATHDVYREIEQLAEILKETWRPIQTRIDAKHALVSSSERLCNLMALAVYQLDKSPQSVLRDQLKSDLDALKNQLMGLGARLMVEKLEKIDKRAQSVLEERDYPIGLAGKLDIAFNNLMANLKVLGGAEKLGEAVPDLVAKTETNLKSLADIETQVGVLVEVRPTKRKR